MNLFEQIDPRRGARRSDPETSHDGAEAVRWRSGNHKIAILNAYRHTGKPLSDREAWQNSALRDKHSCCWWKRCSELRDLGMIEVVSTTVCQATGSRVQRCAITDKGRLALSQIEP